MRPLAATSRDRARARWGRAFLALVVLAWSAPAAAATPLGALYVSPDSALALGGLTVLPQNVAETTAVSLANLGPLPAEANVVGYHHRADGTQLVVLDVSASLPGGIYATPADVIAFDGATYTLRFQGHAQGVPDGVAIDAVAAVDDDLLLSFDTAVALNGFTAAQEDLVRVGPGGFSLFFDGSAASVTPGLDLDGAERLPSGNLLLSFDGSGSLGGVAFDDEDILEHDPVGDTWMMAYDGSTSAAGWQGADLDAIAAEPLATPTRTSTASFTPTPSSTPSSTALPTSSPTATATETPVPTSTRSPTATTTETTVPTSTMTPTTSATETRVPSATESRTATATQTGTATPSASASATRTPSATATSAAVSPTPTPSISPSITPTPFPATATPTATPSPEISPTTTGAPLFLAGDANCDGRVNAADVTELVKLVVDEDSQCGSDANCNGVTDAADLDAAQALLFAASHPCP